MSPVSLDRVGDQPSLPFLHTAIFSLSLPLIIPYFSRTLSFSFPSFCAFLSPYHCYRSVSELESPTTGLRAKPQPKLNLVHLKRNASFVRFSDVVRRNVRLPYDVSSYTSHLSFKNFPDIFNCSLFPHWIYYTVGGK